MKRPIITLVTDFGTNDGYVGAIKGVIKRINPQVEIVDITHDIEPFNILGAAFTLNNFYGYFPQNTIHLVVVDPGVGSKRQPLLIKTENFYFVGPDNGIFSFVLQNESINEIINLSNDKYHLSKSSSTFHARDIFAPVAAYLSLGVVVKEFGAPAKECIKLVIPQPQSSKKGIVGEIIHIDNFGNLITNIDANSIKASRIMIEIKKKKINRISKSYFDIPEKKIGAVVGSSNLLEISINQGNASQILKANIGTPIRVNFN
jgi:hypothetical protein